MKDIDMANQVLLKAVGEMAAGVTTLIGEPVECPAIEGKILAGREFSRQLKGTMVLSRLEVSGDWTGDAYLLTEAKTAIILGGKLIMLPAEELEERISSQNFDGELADAFGEISNIVTSVLNSGSLTGSSRKLHFVRQEVKLETVSSDPAAVLPVLGENTYYIATTPVRVQQEGIGEFRFLLPTTLLGLDDTTAPVAAEQPATGAGAPTTEPPPTSDIAQPPLVMIVAEQPQEGAKIAALLGKSNFQVLQVAIQEDPRSALKGRDVQGVLLLMREVNDQGFAAAIKLRAAINTSTPLIAAGPGWTRKAVLQVIKYGACDILISPVAEKDLLDKLQKHLFNKQD